MYVIVNNFNKYDLQSGSVFWIVSIIFDKCSYSGKDAKDKDAVVIPQNTSYELQHMTFVYKVVDGKAVANPIQVLRVDGGKEYIVEMGLYPGDTIVAEGVALLREGTPIKPKQAPAQPTK